MAILYRAAVLLLFSLTTSNVFSRPILTSAKVKALDDFLKEVTDAEPDEEFDELSAEGQQNSWELSGKFEGDIILNDVQHNMLLQEIEQPGLARNGLNDVSKRWPEKTLLYSINEDDFTSEQMQAITDGMADLERLSCLKFKEKSSGDDGYVRIQGKRRGCYSRVGYQGNEQVLNLTPHPVGLGCMSHGTIVHELLHALGFFHMQSHTKRDDYVKIMWDNILDGRENNFKKYSSFVTTDFGVPYDYESVLHYSSHAFSKNGRKTIVPVTDDFVTIGQRVGLSDKDITKLNRMYKCGAAGGRSPSKGGGGFGGLEPFSDEDETFVHPDVERRKPENNFWTRPTGDHFPRSSYEFKGWWER